MFERDFIMKQINQLPAVLTHILTALVTRKKDQYEEFQFEEINEQLREHFSFDISVLLSLNNDSIIHTLKTEYRLNNELIGQLGDILYEIAELEQNIYPEEKLYQKSLVIFQYLEQHDSVFSFDRHQRIKLMTDDR